MNRNLSLNMIAATQQHGPRTALKLGDYAMSYNDLEAASARVAGLLQARGVAPGDRVGLMVPNVPEFAAIYYGILRAGAIVIPMNVLLKEREVAFYLGDPQARLVFAWHEFASSAEAGAAQAGAEVVLVGTDAFTELLATGDAVTEVAERDGDDTAVILYTSGTTGKPKGAELTHAGLARNVEVLRELLSLRAQDVVLGALPLFHAFGQVVGLGATISSGGCLTLIPRFDPGVVLEMIERDTVTVFEGVPTMYATLLNHPERSRFDTSALRLCVAGGAALPVEVLRGFEAAFGCKLLEGYGMSETSPVISFNHADRERKAGSIGTPIEGVEMRLVDEHRREVEPGEAGEIAIRGHNVMKGYWNRPDATAEAIDADGWFYSGDIGRVDEDGYYFIVDRKKDMIIRGGYNVYPREIEEVLYEHPAVREAAVIGVPHPELGEEIAAAVALKAGAEATADELRDHVKRLVAAYKYPRHVFIVEELPKGPTGKILKRSIELPVLAARRTS
jgi:long-chain acyl-CoA synthetase